MTKQSVNENHQFRNQKTGAAVAQWGATQHSYTGSRLRCRFVFSQRYSMICELRQKAVPPPRTSHRPSTEKHVWLCVSSTAPGKEWLKTHRQPVKEELHITIDHITIDIRVHHTRLEIGDSPQIAMNIAKATVPSLSNRWLTCVDTNTSCIPSGRKIINLVLH